MTRWKTDGLRGLIIATAFYGTSLAGIVLPEFGARVPLVWLPNAIAAALLYLWGLRLWPAVAMAFAGLALTREFPLVAALPSLVGTLASAVLFGLVLRALRFDPAFSRGHHAATFALAAIASQAVFATGGALGRVLAGLSLADALPLWQRLFLGSFSGTMLVPPVLFAFASVRGRWFRRPLETAGWFAMVLGACAAILAGPGPDHAFTLAVFAQFVVVWSALRLDARWCSLGVFSIATCAALAYAFGVGVLHGVPLELAHTLVVSFVAALAGLTLLMNGLLAERSNAERRYRALFDGNPLAAWVHTDDGRIVMANRAAARQYGWELGELAGRAVSTLDHASQPGPERPPPAEGGPPPAVSARHRRRDGSRLDVETYEQPLDLDGRAARLVYAVDVSERRRWENAAREATDRERQRIAMDLHDGLGQELAGLAMLAASVATQAERSRSPLQDAARQLVDVARQAIASCRRIAHGLAPVDAVHGGLRAALQQLVARAQPGPALSISWIESGDPEGLAALPSATVEHLYRIGQEAFSNALRHAGARTVEVRLEWSADSVTVAVVDDGRGLGSVDHESCGTVAGLGMRTMKLRAVAIDARLEVVPAPGGGTRVACTWRPLRTVAATG